MAGCRHAAQGGVGVGSPKHEALQNVGVLPLVVVGQPGATRAHGNAEIEALLNLVWLEVFLHVCDHAVDRVPIEQQKRVVVRDAVHTIQKLFLAEVGFPVPTQYKFTSADLKSDRLTRNSGRTLACMSKFSTETHRHLQLGLLPQWGIETNW